jgi:hypothetical protein
LARSFFQTDQKKKKQTNKQKKTPAAAERFEMNGKKQETDANKDSRMLKLLHNQETNGPKTLSQQKAKNHRNFSPSPLVLRLRNSAHVKLKVPLKHPRNSK